MLLKTHDWCCVQCLKQQCNYLDSEFFEISRALNRDALGSGKALVGQTNCAMHQRRSSEVVEHDEKHESKTRQKSRGIGRANWLAGDKRIDGALF